MPAQLEALGLPYQLVFELLLLFLFVLPYLLRAYKLLTNMAIPCQFCQSYSSEKLISLIIEILSVCVGRIAPYLVGRSKLILYNLQNWHWDAHIYCNFLI